MLTLKANELRATLHASAKNDVRYYLNGTLLENRGQKFYLVSTDGHMLFAGEAHVEYDGDPNLRTWKREIIIQRETIELALKVNKVNVVLKAVSAETYSLGGVEFTPIDAKYPDWLRVTPTEISGDTAQFNPDLLVRGNKALCDWHGSKGAIGHLQHNGNAAALLTCSDPTCYVVVMPMRSGASSKPFKVDQEQMAQAA